MDPLSLTLGLSQTLGGLICIGLSIPLLRGKIKPNPSYGVRFRQTFQSEAAWFAINRYWAKRMIGWAVLMVLLGVTAFFVPLLSHRWLLWLMTGAVLTCVVVPAVQSWLYAKREWDKRGSQAG